MNLKFSILKKMNEGNIVKEIKLLQEPTDSIYYKKYQKVYKKLKQVEKTNLELRKIVEEYKWKEFYQELGEEYIIDDTIIL